jgi:SAM-dependent methyltransferase
VAEPTADELIAQNVRVHDRIAAEYQKRHPEIFNDVEQARLAAALAEALAAVRTGARPVRALDFGCGSGNLARHLLALGCHVTASDVSARFLELLARSVADPSRLTTHRLNGRDLSELPDASLDFAATYSVLHHVPDYLHAVGEMARVVRPGGVVYIDHEVCAGHWDPSPALQDYRRAIAPPPPPPPSPLRFLSPATYLRKAREVLDPRERERRRLRRENPRWREEGDIHVFPDDHVEWARVEAVLASSGFEVVFKREFLHYSARHDRATWERYRDCCADMCVLAARRRGVPESPAGENAAP